MSKDIGNSLAGILVARTFSVRGITMTYALDRRGAAWKKYTEDEVFRVLFGTSVRVVGAESFHDLPAGADFLVVTLSASGPPNLEQEVCRSGIPAYGLEEVLGGRHNPGWELSEPKPIALLRRVFTVLPTSEDGPAVTVVGPPQLERYRGVDVAALGRQAREKLGISLDTPLVYYIGHPEPENPHALSRVGEALSRLPQKDVVLVVSRHSRDKEIPDNGPAHRHTLRHIQKRVGIRVIENSLGHKDLPEDHPEAIPREFCPENFATYQELVCACRSCGVIVTGFATDGTVVAPHLGVPSVLYLDCENYLFGGLLRREKCCDRLPLPLIPQVATVEALVHKLNYCLTDYGGRRERYCATLREKFPFPERDPADKIADLVLQDLGEANAAASISS
ncbi:MAG: hypothetical protein G01um101438_1036 [Parcubacteria group bacterium Gr01-1014_38]|nr:MAG: hypothetical protein G01um101438_1036 [Parcubacteria group bacterium Gr01-1014_38]